MTERAMSRRLRRVRTTLAAALVGGSILGAGVYAVWQRSQPEEYRPGQTNADITASLAQGIPAEAPRPRFTDVTADAGLGPFRTFAGRRSSQLPEDMGSGAAWGDFDNDGDDDLFIVSAGGALGRPPQEWAPSLLYENAGGRFRLVERFPDLRIIGLGAAWIDVDSDGWLDLIVTGYDAVHLYRNRGGAFVRDPQFPNRPGFWAGVAVADYDRDGDPDFYVCGYVRYVAADADRARVSEQFGTSVPYTLNPASYKPERNLLFRNDGTGRFTEVAESLGVANPEGRSLSALWHDLDGDGWLDLYVANDISDNVFYANRGGRFVDVSHPAWVADHRGAMGLAAGDWNGDGDEDLFVTHWVAQENALYDSLLVDAASRPVPAAAAAGATEARVRFVDAADAVGLGQIALPMVGWGTEFIDVDADGWLDLVVANGSTFETADPPRSLKPQPPFLFWNRAGRFFHDVAPLAAALAAPRVGRGLAVSDYDGDGDPDILIVEHGGGVQLLRNDMPQGGWIKLVLRARGRSGATVPAWGAHAVVDAAGRRLHRTLSTASYLSQSSSVLHVGLGAATRVDALEIRWPGGSVTTLRDLAAGRTWEVVEGADAPAGRDGAAASSAPAAGPVRARLDRDRQARFWQLQRAGMDALKGGNGARAIVLFREALQLHAAHEDTRYYLGSALADHGDVEQALEQFDALRRSSPQSHRAHTRWGTLRARHAETRTHLVDAETALLAAYRLNPEETGVLLSLAEIALLRGDLPTAGRRLSETISSNPRAARAFFLLGYARWKGGDPAAATRLLVKTREVLGPEWKPAGTTAEGDVHRAAHVETSPLAEVFDRWDGTTDPALAYAELERRVRLFAGSRAS